jgi:acylphosphatase
VKIHFDIQVRGKVQGVFYRASAQQKAQELKLVGYAQNQPDGGVFIEVEGEKEILETFVSWCRQGPARAVVTEVLVTESVLKNYSEFLVKR